MPIIMYLIGKNTKFSNLSVEEEGASLKVSVMKPLKLSK